MPSNVPAKIEFCDRKIWSAQTWIDDHGKRFPEHSVEAKRQDIAMLQEIRSDYQRSLDAAEARKTQG